MGYEIARALNAPLDVFITRKFGAPGRPEFGIDAVVQGGLRALNAQAIRALSISKEHIERMAAEETAEIERRLSLLCGDHPEPKVRQRTVILVDDGLATGVTARAAIEVSRRRAPRRLILAEPVCALTVEVIHPEVDDLVCLQSPSSLMAIGLWHRNFEQVADEEVIELLESARREQEERDVSGPDERT